MRLEQSGGTFITAQVFELRQKVVGKKHRMSRFPCDAAGLDILSGFAACALRISRKSLISIAGMSGRRIIIAVPCGATTFAAVRKDADMPSR